VPAASHLDQKSVVVTSQVAWDAADPTSVPAWLKSEFPGAGFGEADAITFLERFAQSPATDRMGAARRIAKRMAAKKSGPPTSSTRGRASQVAGSRHVLKKPKVKRVGRNLPTVSDKVPKVQPLPPMKSLAQDPTAGKPDWHKTSPGGRGSIDGKGPPVIRAPRGGHGR
jgi:hypothetical protein